MLWVKYTYNENKCDFTRVKNLPFCGQEWLWWQNQYNSHYHWNQFLPLGQVAVLVTFPGINIDKILFTL